VPCVGANEILLIINGGKVGLLGFLFVMVMVSELTSKGIIQGISVFTLPLGLLLLLLFIDTNKSKDSDV